MTARGDFRATVESRLDAFLAHPTKRVLLFSGKWGVGKTYFWSNAYVRERLKDRSRISEKCYAYVSLFGVGSVEDIEQLIFAKSLKVGDPNVLDKATSGLRKAAAYAEDLPWVKDYAGIVRRIGHLCIRNTLVCLDDMERKAAGLSIGSIMGLVSTLREQNDCRIIIISNDEEIVGDDREEFEKYREKVVDETVTYAPDIGANVGLIFGKDSACEEYCKTFRRIGMNNIRIMQQVRWVCEHFAAYFPDLEPAIQEQLREHIVLLTCFFHDRSLGIDVSNLPRGSLYDHFFNQAAEENPEHKKQEQLSSKYGYHVQEYDALIVDYLRRGDCDESSFNVKLRSVNGQEKRSQVHSKYRAVWKPYTDSFAATTREVVNGFRQFLDEYARELAFDELQQSMQVMKSLGVRSGFSKWQDAWVAKHIGTSDLPQLLHLRTLCRGQAVRKKVEARIKQLRKAVNVPELVTHVSDRQSWGPQLLDQLDAYDLEDLKAQILRHHEENFLSAIRELCDIWRKAGPKERAVEAKIEQALMEISTTNRLNQLRVRMLIPWRFEDEQEEED